MSKFSFYDFITFIVPGGTMVILLMYFFNLLFPEINIITSIDKSILIIPFLFFSFICGHILSSLGIFIENTVFNAYKPFKLYFKKYPKDFKLIKKLSKEKFDIKLTNKGVIDSAKTQILYIKVTDLMEVNDKDNIPVILLRQYAFFRNSATLALITFLFSISNYLYNNFIHNDLNQSINMMIISSLSLLLVLVCTFFSRQRKKLMIENYFRNFIAMNVSVI